MKLIDDSPAPDFDISRFARSHIRAVAEATEHSILLQMFLRGFRLSDRENLALVYPYQSVKVSEDGKSIQTLLPMVLTHDEAAALPDMSDEVREMRQKLWGDI